MFCFWFWIGWWENRKSLIYRIALNGRVKFIGFRTQASERGRGRISISFFFLFRPFCFDPQEGMLFSLRDMDGDGTIFGDEEVSGYDTKAR